MLQLATVPFSHSLCVFDALSQQDLDQPAVAKGALGQTGNSSVACIRSSRNPAARMSTCTHFTNVKILILNWTAPHLVQSVSETTQVLSSRRSD